ncbi:AAA family ATPase [Francisella frigiditurris]|uniref:AAA domain protein n=1 Tax=Francisella frigiditurris TaxID=1542390 RepID=A0A1J0KU54_9GAMM|nr:AAA family ATPase [Francisella frigiditurris]APC97312.1 AAA domain protein [Francisella frigiditurris]
MIKSLDIKYVATYDEHGIQLADLKKVNFIYGANGCGKTTISNFIYNPQEPKYNACAIEWTNGLELQTLVYNKAFRDRNFGKGKIAGVFTLGEATKEDLEEIDRKQKELEDLKSTGIKKKETLQKQKEKRQDSENKFRDDVWADVYKKYESDFKEAFRGTMQKESFKNKLLLESKNNTKTLEIYEKLKEKARTIFGKQLQKIDPISIISSNRVIEIEKNKIWNKTIIGKADVDIAKLIQKLNISDWVSQGKDYIQDKTCPFCQKETITDEFSSQLEEFFDDTYLHDVNEVSSLKDNYNTLTQNIINQLNEIEQYQKNLGNSKLDLEKFSSYLKTLTSQITTNYEYLNNKVKEPSRSINLTSISQQFELIIGLIEKANFEISKHNSIVDNFQKEKKELLSGIWQFLSSEYKDKIDAFNKEQKGLKTGISNLQDQLENERKMYKNLKSCIEGLNKNVTSIQPTIDEINRLLKYYGFLNFEIVPTKDDGFYQIQREDGTSAEATLSEGEVTFITFLYYLQLTKGSTSKEDVNNERVLIIDDPISSLDSNVLFVVSTLIKDIIQNVKTGKGSVKQIILLTHNVYFHKEISFINSRIKECNETNFWILRKNNTITTLQAFGESNPIQSSYELLWCELNSSEYSSTLTIQNIMRRIIENYFKLLGKYRDDDLISKFETKEEREICRSLISWVNDGSHSMNDDLYIELQDRTIENYKKVFKDIFYKMKHDAHYEMMSKSGKL